MYTKQELIDEIYRANKELGRVPRLRDMIIKNGYISGGIFKKVFGSWSNALIIAGFVNKVYTKQELIDEVYRANRELGRVPKSKDMQICKGYTPIDEFYKVFESWDVVLKAAELKINIHKKYTHEELIYILQEYYKQYKKSPTQEDFDSNEKYPSSHIFKTHFSTWNNALKIAKLPLNMIHTQIPEIKVCSVCDCTTSENWVFNKNKELLCYNCYQFDRKFVNGVLNPNCTSGIAVITEHVVYNILGDCIKCNNNNSFANKYDLISEKYGNINVKSAKLILDRNIYRWTFSKTKNSQIPDYYICIGFNANKIEIKHVWFIPGNSKLVTTRGINISLNQLQRAEQYEVDPTLYNKIYKSLDIYTLSEFRNLLKPIDGDITISEQLQQEVS